MRLRPHQNLFFNFPNHALSIVAHVTFLETHLAASGKVLTILDGEDTTVMVNLCWDVLSMCQSPLRKVQTKVLSNLVFFVKIVQDHVQASLVVPPETVKVSDYLLLHIDTNTAPMTRIVCSCMNRNNDFLEAEQINYTPTGAGEPFYRLMSTIGEKLSEVEGKTMGRLTVVFDE